MSGYDRSGCASWCGLRYRHQSVPVSAFLASGTTSSAEPAWCSARCRDAALPPLGASPSEPQRPMGGGVQDHSPGSAPAAKADCTGGRGSSSIVSPPVPAVGQRRLCRVTDCQYDIVSAVGLVGIRFVDSGGEGRFAMSTIAKDRYLGPTPPAVSPPGEVLGPPYGYVPCPNCSGARWKPEDHCWCWRCIGRDAVDRHPETPDWTPPAQPGVKPLSNVVVAGPQSTNRPGRYPDPKHPPGIKCSRCLVTSEGGDVHLETCVVKDFAAGDVGLTSAEWSARVTTALGLRALDRWRLARPFIPSITDEDLFGKAVR